MKKFLAVLLASVMTLALATPVMATVKPYVNYVYIDIEGLTEGETTSDAYNNISLEVTKLNTNEVLTGAASIDIAKSRWQVLGSGGDFSDYTGSEFVVGQTYRVKLAIVKSDDFDFSYVNYRYRYLPDTNPQGGATEWGGSDFNYVYSNALTVAEKTKVESIELTLSPKVGDNVYNTTPTVVATPANSAYVYDATWGRYPIGDTFGGSSTEVLQGGATFEQGYVYVYIPYIYASSGYKLDDDSTTLIVNGDSTTYTFDGMDVSPVIAFTMEDAPEKETTTAIETTATTTATSTTVKTGDSTNAMFYVITLIALVAAAGVTVFAAKKSR